MFGCKTRSNLGGGDSAQRIGLERIVSRSDLFLKPTLQGVIPDHQQPQVRFTFPPNMPCFRSLSNSANQDELRIYPWECPYAEANVVADEGHCLFGTITIVSVA